jgi:hypothetical protein
MKSQNAYEVAYKYSAVVERKTDYLIIVSKIRS